MAVAHDENDMQPLHYACASAMFKLDEKYRSAQVRIARMLIEAGADPMATYAWDVKWKIPALYHCCGQHDNPAVAEVLMRAGAMPQRCRPLQRRAQVQPKRLPEAGRSG